MTAKQLGISILLLIPATVSFAFVSSIQTQLPGYPSSNSPRDCTSTTTTYLCSSSSNQYQQDAVDTTSKKMAAQSIPKWFQHEISITAPSRGCHLITNEVTKAIRGDLEGIKIGMANLFIQHTSASLTINENADPDVRR